MPVRFRRPGGQVPQRNVPDQHRHRPALPLGAMCALIDYSVPADAVVVQEAIAGGTDVTADVFAEAGDVIGGTA